MKMSTLPAAVIPDTEVRAMESSELGRDFRVSIALPYEYPDLPDKHYPVVYILDANLYFGMFTELSRMLYLCGMTETIIVGLGYPVDERLEEAFAEISSLRTLDLTPAVDKDYENEQRQNGAIVRGTGRAADFLSFIEDDVIPMIETEYRAIPADRTLVGHSFGGLFALFTLFQRPTLFQQLIVGSPSLHFAKGVVFDYEEEYSMGRRSLPVKLFLSVGAMEESPGRPMVSDLYRLRARLESREYEGLELTFRVFEECNHCAAIAPMFQFGMMALMPPRS